MWVLQSTRAPTWPRDPRLILFAACLIVIAYAFPGYMNFDAAEQLFQARTAKFDDWHPPLMAAYWRLLEMVTRGPFLMLVLQTSLFAWGLYTLLRRRFGQRAAAIVAACLLVFPPILTPMAVVWKDAQMAGLLLGGTAFALSPRVAVRLLGCTLLLLAVGVRDNAVAALPPLLALITSEWCERRVRALLIAAGLLVLLVAGAMGLNRAIRDVPAHPWYLSTAIHDIAGSICNAGILDDAEVRELTAGVPLVPTSNLQTAICRAYKSRVWFELAYGDAKVFDPDPPAADREARRASWNRIVRAYPTAFLAHRWDVTREILGLTSSEPWEPVPQTFAATPEQLSRIKHNHSMSWFQRRVGQLFDALSKTLLFRPWVYLSLCLVMAGYSAWRRHYLILSVALSGFLYELSLFAFASAPDFRYSHWMISCTCIVIALVIRERLRARASMIPSEDNTGPATNRL